MKDPKKVKAAKIGAANRAKKAEELQLWYGQASFEERMEFESKRLYRGTFVDENTGCVFKRHKWDQSKNNNHYGVIQLYDGRYIQRHRLALMIKLGRELGEGMQSHHTCDRPGCINQSHLWEGTQSENLHDMSDKGRHWHQDPKRSTPEVRKRIMGIARQAQKRKRDE